MRATRKGKDSGGPREVMSVTVPHTVAPVLGDYRSVVFNVCIRMVHHLVAGEMLVLAKKMSSQDWAYLNECWEDISDMSPDSPNCAEYLANIIERSQERYKIGDQIYGKNSDKEVKDLASRIRSMGYVSIWGIVLNVMFKATYYNFIEQGDPWWDVAYRRQFFTKHPIGSIGRTEKTR